MDNRDDLPNQDTWLNNLVQIFIYLFIYLFILVMCVSVLIVQIRTMAPNLAW